MLLLLATLVVGVVGVQLVGAVVAISLAAIAFVAPTPTLVVGVVGVKLVSPVVASSLVHFLRRPIPAVGGDWHKWRAVRMYDPGCLAPFTFSEP